MAVRAEVVLTDEERVVLERWARRPKSSQALALRCRIVLAAAEGVQVRRSLPILAVARTRSGNGVVASRAAALTACTTSRGRGSRAQLAMRMLNG